jgi:formylglycine-generating enzyme required for sulfatase activity
MRKRILIVRVIVLAILVIGLSSLTLLKTKNQFVLVAPKLFVAKCEVTNSEFREFLNSNNVLREKCMYDSVQWTKKFPFAHNEPLVNFYHWHPAYDDYPVVNISFEAAEAYCEWITQVVNNNKKRKFKKVVYRLPKEAEWLMFSDNNSEGLVYASDNKTALANIKIKNETLGGANYKFDGCLHTARVGSFKVNSLGLYDIFGNVYELTSERAQKGGSWDSFQDDCHTDKSQQFDLPDPRVGFRVVMEIIEE